MINLSRSTRDLLTLLFCSNPILRPALQRSKVLHFGLICYSAPIGSNGKENAMAQSIRRLIRKLFFIGITLLLGIQADFYAPVQSTEAGTGTLVNVPATSANLQ